MQIFYKKEQKKATTKIAMALLVSLLLLRVANYFEYFYR